MWLTYCRYRYNRYSRLLIQRKSAKVTADSAALAAGVPLILQAGDGSQGALATVVEHLGEVLGAYLTTGASTASCGIEGVAVPLSRDAVQLLAFL